LAEVQTDARFDVENALNLLHRAEDAIGDALRKSL
jgi:hypothetical protein